MLLKDRKWKEFYICDIFITENKKTIQVPTGAYVHKKNLCVGSTPRITVTSQNNGVDGYYKSNDKNYRTFKNFISVSFLGTIFYHPYEASIDMKVHCLQLIKRKLNLWLSQFLITEIKNSIKNVSYANQLSSTDLPNKKIMLPVTESGQPDYDFMESYVKWQENRKKQEYIAYAKKVLSKLEYKRLPSLKEKEYGDFNILDLFNYKRGNQNNMNSLIEGNNMLISAKNINNGLKGFYKSNNDKETVYQGDCITLNNDGDGGVGMAYYQPYKFLLDTHVYALYSKMNINRYAKLYITLALSKQRICFSHARSISKERLEKMKIMLPTNEKNQPDYGYMEQYVKNMLISKYQSYINYLSE